MSLINDMLRNLESHRKKTVTPENIILDLPVNFSHQVKLNKKYYYSIALLIGVLALITLPLLKKVTHVNVTHRVDSPLEPTSTSLPLSILPSVMTGITLQMQQDMTFLRFLLNQNTLYQLNSDASKHQLTITLENTHLAAELPKVNYIGSGIENIQSSQEKNGNLKIILTLNEATDVKRIELNKEGKAPELQLDLLYKNSHTTEENLPQFETKLPVVIKRPVLESVIDSRYKQALALTKNGNDADAIAILSSLVQADSAYSEPRILLVNLLIKNNKMDVAKKILDQALLQEHVNPYFAEQKAQILVDEGKVKNALKLLEEFAPPLADNPEYHAFIAALYQQQGMNKLAASLYKQLLFIDPSNSKWWLGLGVSLDEMGQASQASEAYANADKNGNLNPEIKAYIESRDYA